MILGEMNQLNIGNGAEYQPPRGQGKVKRLWKLYLYRGAA